MCLCWEEALRGAILLGDICTYSVTAHQLVRMEIRYEKYRIRSYEGVRRMV